ncbi:hypothetical protein [Novipirellula maiorica]|uniref:hypothetical protein n=1 Tax=Novipirellula maiorica TaxID=1265734 RepID=UPI001181BC4D|nr:hypothetical protein [Rhodopirellula maiorica]
MQSEQLAALNRCHTKRRKGHELSTSEKRDVFKAFFLNEQETVVGPSINSATETFQWPLMRFIALRPLVRFAYFGRRQSLFFRNFANQDERIEKGLYAFSVAAAVGWDHVEATLRDYEILPDAFFAGSSEHFDRVHQTVLATV